MLDRSAKLRAFFARYISLRAGVSDPHIEEAFAAIPREPFAGPPPWFILVMTPWGPRPTAPAYAETPDDDPAFLYQDVLVALDPERGINIGEPSLHARCLDALALQEGESVLHVGAGSGYYTSILAHLVGPSGTVQAYEIDPALAERAQKNLVPISWVTLHVRSGLGEGLPTADVIYVNAGLTQPHLPWLGALRSGGRLLFPLQARGGVGGMLLVRRPRIAGAVWPASFVTRAAFIACQGPQDDEAGQRLATAFAGGGGVKVQALHLDDKPDATCWFKGNGWWLSTRAPAAGL